MLYTLTCRIFYPRGDELKPDEAGVGIRSTFKSEIEKSNRKLKTAYIIQLRMSRFRQIFGPANKTCASSSPFCCSRM